VKEGQDSFILFISDHFYSLTLFYNAVIIRISPGNGSFNFCIFKEFALYFLGISCIIMQNFKMDHRLKRLWINSNKKKKQTLRVLKGLS